MNGVVVRKTMQTRLSWCAFLTVSWFVSPCCALDQDLAGADAAGPAAPRDTSGTPYRTIVEFLLNEAEPSPNALKAGGAKTIVAIESFLDERNRSATNDASGLIGRLKAPDPEVRRKAIGELVWVSENMLPLIEARAQKPDSAEEAERLAFAGDCARQIQSRIGEVLSVLGELYAENLAAIVAERWPKLLANPDDMRLIRTFDLVPFEKMWDLLQTKDKDQQVTYLLLKMYTGERQEAFYALRKFCAADVLKVASATWWPVEISPIHMNGAYGWTRRARKVQGNEVLQIMNLSVAMPNFGNVDDRGKWFHFEREYRWAYIFRYRLERPRGPSGAGEDNRPWVGSLASFQAVVLYVEPLRQGDLSKWAANGPDILSLGEGHLRVSTEVGSTARLPMVRISVEESDDWDENAYEWARPLFPPRLMGRVKFLPNKYPVPRIEYPQESRSDR